MVRQIAFDGLDLLKIIKETSPQTECVMVTANDSIPQVIEAIKRGAYDFLVKPITPEQLIHSLDRALERKRLLESLLLRQQTDCITDLIELFVADDPSYGSDRIRCRRTCFT